MKATLLAILGALIGFLMGAFYNVGFDISLWSNDSRFATEMIMVFMAFCGGFGKLIVDIGC
jgi:hypothetical protein